MMKIAFIADPLHTFKIYKDSTYAMMAEAARRGHAIYTMQQKDMSLANGTVSARVSRISLTGDSANWYHVEEVTETRLAEYDAIVVRKDPPFNMEYVYLTYLLELAEGQGARVFNRPGAIRSHNEKLSIAQFPEFTAPTLVTSSPNDVRAFHADHKDIILKPLDGMGGAGIFRVREDGMNLGSIVESLIGNSERTIMVQRYIPEIAQGDKRVLLIGGQVVPYCLARIPQAGEVRGNLAAGGKGVARPVSARDREIGEALGPLLSKRGLLLVGLDVIGDYLTEVNVTSPTCFQEITKQTGFDVAAMFMDALESAATA